MRWFAILVAFVALLLPLPAAAQDAAAAPEFSATESAFQLLWDEGAPPLADQLGAATTWVPVSFRLILTEDMNIEVEIRNTADTPMATPDLVVKLMSEGQSLGTEIFASENEWVPAGGSAFYQYLNVFGGSLFIGDWDETILTVDTDTFLSPNMGAYESLIIDGDRISNNGTQTIGEISFISVLRDAEGIYSASCSGPETGANLLPGKSVRARGLGDNDDPGGCGFAIEGIAGSESLNIGGPFTEEHVIARIRTPE